MYIFLSIRYLLGKGGDSKVNETYILEKLVWWIEVVWVRLNRSGELQCLHTTYTVHALVTGLIASVYVHI